MAARSRDPGIKSVESSPKRILRDSRTPSDATISLQEPDMEGNLAAFLVANVLQNTASGAPRGISSSVPEEEEIE